MSNDPRPIHCSHPHCKEDRGEASSPTPRGEKFRVLERYECSGCRTSYTTQTAAIACFDRHFSADLGGTFAVSMEFSKDTYVPHHMVVKFIKGGFEETAAYVLDDDYEE